MNKTTLILSINITRQKHKIQTISSSKLATISKIEILFEKLY